MGNAKEGLEYLATTKSLIKQAIIDKGVEVSDTDTFRSYKDKIAGISGGGSAPELTDINMGISSSAITNIDSAGITFVPVSASWQHLASSYTTTKESNGIALDKDLTHYELSLNVIPYYISNNRYGICWRGYNEQGMVINTSSSESTSSIQPKSDYATSVGSSISYSSYTNVIIKYTFSDNITVNVSVDNGATYTAVSYVAGTPSTITSVTSLFIFGDSDSSGRWGAGKILFKNTYIKDLDTNTKVWELVDGRS